MQMMTKRGIQWLSASADDPQECRERWAADPRAPYALAAGRYFDVVVIGQRIGMETFEQLARHGMPMGPVMLDRSAKLTGFFLPSGQRERFARMLINEDSGPLAYR
ncbi:bifunctional DNA primase/polymerase [Streptomyces tubbatahanensis]|uniref:Bifunctional DNA primase/polymerase n=1 Tax=Streptomyces tubbatahanensis TaxID=2923272 RepID=A0ABY3XX90_9ACTN|nr:bifunctional DNA primase/polymerase [Streptomyces tubbatahanensis]UNS98975.1 bifunctional DNA primase/polymerase [Streptomyces tubbatahanensis]